MDTPPDDEGEDPPLENVAEGVPVEDTAVTVDCTPVNVAAPVMVGIAIKEATPVVVIVNRVPGLSTISLQSASAPTLEKRQMAAIVSDAVGIAAVSKTSVASSKSVTARQVHVRPANDVYRNYPVPVIGTPAVVPSRSQIVLPDIVVTNSALKLSPSNPTGNSEAWGLGRP